MKHFYKSIPGFAAFTDIYAEMVRRAKDGAHFVEVGSWQGRSAAFMAVEILNSGKAIRFDCVDHWRPDGALARDGLFEAFLKNTSPVRAVIRPVRLPSVAAAQRYFDGTLDFVMIDASHRYPDVSADIAAWRPKVRPGGVLAGDDYWFAGVKQAVDEFFPAATIHRQDTRTKQFWSVPCIA